jgi:hypothetical protein
VFASNGEEVPTCLTGRFRTIEHVYGDWKIRFL